MVIFALLFSLAPAQPPASGPAATAAYDDPDAGPSLLAAVRDDSFNFDEPAFYWLLRRAHREAGERAANEQPTPWRFLLERPSEYRGRRVVVEGFVLSSLEYEILREGRSLGKVIQTELSESGTRGLCTIVTTGNRQPLPIGARIRGAAWFLKARRFTTTTGQTASAPLLVGNQIEVIAPAGALSEQGAVRRAASRSRDWLVVGIVALAAVWFVMRRTVARPRDRRP